VLKYQRNTIDMSQVFPSCFYLFCSVGELARIQAQGVVTPGTGTLTTELFSEPLEAAKKLNVGKEYLGYQYSHAEYVVRIPNNATNRARIVEHSPVPVSGNRGGANQFLVTGPVKPESYRQLPKGALSVNMILSEPSTSGLAAGKFPANDSMFSSQGPSLRGGGWISMRGLYEPIKKQ
jgi:hypothetical protein